MKGKKTGGGSRKGIPNKNQRTSDVLARLAELKCDPIEGMAMIALDPNSPPELRGRMFAELAQYTAPKLRGIEQTSEVTHRYVARVPNPQPDLDEWQRQYADLKTKPTTLQ